ncbi:amino acid transporter [Basidiobolus meristosporus CBS 931.73]|uniref:Amino acid transporter n=1 Tax=Basidiobolus meristosporus CBS 931.73 TaxID=1314790 RepID=A0A1Y1YV06_9FUNG|nr:amino acid transporter [Basidiobolus meristosporus CBS 931.73]|eukprot:ORY01873.1 amino acid transporter [Basidiobolus meristosporus CBS 931.73]
MRKQGLVSYEAGKKPWWLRLFTVKSMEQIQTELASSEMKRTLDIMDLASVGIGVTIGTGIFTLTGVAAAEKAGPAIVVSFIVSGIAAAFTALSYSEMASMIPVAGSAYTYTYAAMGELIGWIIGWDLILEYLVGAATTAVAWSAYLVAFLEIAFDYKISTKWVNSPIKFESGSFMTTGDYLNVPAVVISLVITTLLCFGIRESTRVNSVMVSIKVIVVLLTIFACIKHINPANYTPFIPPNEGRFARYGVSGVFSAASTVFFAYIGFDIISTTAQEAKNPQRDLPIVICGSLVVCIILYIGVCLIMTGVVPYKELHPFTDSSTLGRVAAPITILVARTGMTWLSIIIGMGIVFGLASIMLILLMGQPRIFNAMAKDGLFPEIAARIHPKYKTPWFTTTLSGVLCALLGGMFPVDVLSDITTAGTLFAFFFVNIGVIVLRFRCPDTPRRFKIPLGPFVIPVIGAALSIVLLSTTSPSTIIHLAVWIGVGLMVYALYGRTHSKINNPQLSQPSGGKINKPVAYHKDIPLRSLR